MSARTGARAFAAASALLVLGCLDADLCRENSVSSAEPLSSEPYADSVRLSGAGEVTSADFLATLSGLPELWPSEPFALGTATVVLTLAYEAEPRGSDGSTEMPRVEVSVALGSDPPRSILKTTAFPGAQASAGVSLFTPCSSTPDPAVHGQGATAASGACCPYGARECHAPLTVSVRRLDGAPFPPVVAEWSLGVSARVDVCPAAGDPELSFERVSP